MVADLEHGASQRFAIITSCAQPTLAVQAAKHGCRVGVQSLHAMNQVCCTYAQAGISLGDSGYRLQK